MTIDADTRVGHCKSDSTSVYIGRGNGAANIRDTEIGERGWLGNPFVMESHANKSHRTNTTITIVESRAESVEKFRAEFEDRLDRSAEFRRAVEGLAGKTLGCWCQHLNDDGPLCHGEVIAEYADKLSE